MNIGQVIPWGSKNLQDTFPTTGSFLSSLLKNALTVVGLLLLFLLIYGGLMFIIGAGSDDPKKAQAAQGIVTDALIGFAVVFCAYFIIQIIEIITGLSILNPSL